MLSIILIWFYIAVICLAYGCGGAGLLRILLRAKRGNEPRYDARPPAELVELVGGKRGFKEVGSFTPGLGGIPRECLGHAAPRAFRRARSVVGVAD